MNFYKKEQFNILRLLLANEDALQEFQKVLEMFDGDPVLYVDHERYLEMAIRLEPNDVEIIHRK